MSLQFDKTKVLVVDDERVIADMLAMILNRSGFEAFPVYSGEMAVERAQQESFDLLLTDIAMPGINGVETALRIHKLLPGCRIVLFSGQPSTGELLERARAEGLPFALLVKPIHPADLIAALRQ